MTNEEARLMRVFMEYVDELVARIHDGRELMEGGDYPALRAYEMAEKQVDRIVAVRPRLRKVHFDEN